MFTLAGFKKLYDIYVKDIEILKNNCTVSVETRYVKLNKENKSAELISRFYPYFVELNLVDGNHSYLNCDDYNTKYDVYVLSNLYKIYEVDLIVPYFDNACALPFDELYCSTKKFTDPMDIITVITSMENELRRIIDDYEHEFALQLECSCKLYPSPKINIAMSKPETSMQYINMNGVVRHMTCISEPELWYDSSIYLDIYWLFEDVISRLMDTGLVRYTYLTGNERNITTKFISDGLDPSKKWDDISWSIASMIKSITDYGAYIPFMVNIQKDRIELLDGIHRYDALSKTLGLRKLALDLSNVDADAFIGRTTFLLPLELYSNCSWELDAYDIVEEMSAADDSYATVKLTVSKLGSLIRIYFLLFREVNNYVDDGILQKNRIFPSKIINKKEIIK